MSVLRMELIASGPGLDATVLTGLADRARNAKPAMQTILGQLAIEEKRLFDTDGSSGGEKWPDDKPQTVSRERRGKPKRRSVDPSRPERRTGKLERSLTRSRAPGSIRRSSKSQLTFGTRLFYSRFQTKRPLMQFTMEDQATWERTLIGWLMNGES